MFKVTGTQNKHTHLSLKAAFFTMSAKYFLVQKLNNHGKAPSGYDIHKYKCTSHQS